ncbi:hypothetical protein O181_033121 [Austropuccinia psidii MF-1]|uniref:Exonuclease domain-containing protein n=1 Tax=Austropuccinia psidii MF-1 TaxID=1389203 RepID=A0A9Q3H6S6_9BASI|nr:hypothetical protein [Austropuccinia psidii MF-1]
MQSPSLSSTSNHRRKHSQSQTVSSLITIQDPPSKRPKLQSIEHQPTQTISDHLSNSSGNQNHSVSKTKNSDSSQSSSSESDWTLITKNDKTLKAKLKKQQKLEKQIALNPGEFHYDTRGFRYGRMIQLTEIRDLVLSILADERNQEWMMVKNKSSITKVVVIMIPGITHQSLGLSKPQSLSIMPFPIASQNSKLPVFQSLFSHACPTKAAGDRLRMFSCMSVFLNCQLSAMAKVKRDEERKRSSKNTASMDPTVYLLPPEQMLEQDFPSLNYSVPVTAMARQAARLNEPLPTPQTLLPRPPFEDWTCSAPPGFIQTPLYPDSSIGRPLKILGIDCEMCVTASGSELTRCTIVDENGHLVYDQLVLPDLPITDYLTRFSGITADRLQGVSTRLIDVQKKLTELIDFDTALVGHSLDCDLRAVKLAHPWVIDTSVIYQHPRGSPRKPSLKWLASKWLGKDIQAGGNEGHDSQEDARTAVELLKMKMEKGPGFGEFTNDQESFFERIGRGNNPKKGAVVDFGLTDPKSGNGTSRNLWKNATSCSFSSDKEISDTIISLLDDHDFVFGRMMELSYAIGWSQPYKSKELATTDSAIPEKPELDTDKVYHDLDNNLKSLNEKLPKGTALIIFTGHSDPRNMAELNQKKNRFERSLKLPNTISSTIESLNNQMDKWSNEDERNLADEVEKCKMGMSFFRVK